MTTSMRLLLVEDDRVFRERLARAFLARGHQVACCETAAEAIRILQTMDLDGVVVDLRLGESRGLDLVAALREANPVLDIVVLTGFGSIATAMEAVRLGARDYLTKPADPDQILAAFRGRSPSAGEELVIEPEIPSLGRVEWEHIQRVLSDFGGNISKTARVLGIDRRSLQRKLAKYPPPK